MVRLPSTLDPRCLTPTPERNDYATAIPFFESAIRHGAPFEAFYYLASINTQRARAREPSCSVAVAYHKLVAERGNWALNEGGLVLPNENGMWRQVKEDGELGFGGMGAGVKGVGEERMVRWSVESERGDEISQNNLAFVLDQGAFSPTLITYTSNFIQQTNPPSAPPNS
jgi:SEL1 protein